jgi:hypothetical protein
MACGEDATSSSSPTVTASPVRSMKLERGQASWFLKTDGVGTDLD